MRTYVRQGRLAEVKIIAEHNQRVYGTPGERNRRILAQLDPAFLRWLEKEVRT